ncbi:hypothetical protein MVI27_11255 [Chryseobacterium salipaludis]|uniref:FEKKY domain-containing protein n=1 Tax=Chryseobacterium TaxID=59732 RepID=UPI001FF3CC43|nr:MULTISPECIES: hypothetical protein [Chryseobacterium]MCJ8498826.1 hypothetical protein [Chryseobacterium salipaludis]MCX3297394.1 hypothetical protein [Planobacterium sp. JC490]
MKKPILILGCCCFLFSCSTKQRKVHHYTFNIHEESREKTELLPVSIATQENFEQLLQEKKLTFVTYGIMAQDYTDFEEKYGIRVKSENCVIPSDSGPVVENNRLIAAYLTSQFGNGWKNDLRLLPFGLEK